MKSRLSRRDFLAGTVAGYTLVNPSGLWLSADDRDYPLVDYHVHLDDLVTLEKALQLSRERNVKFGIVEHAGTKANKYPGLLSTDEDLKTYIAKLEGKPVLKGIQAEGLDWPTCFSKDVVAQLDYVLSDALTFPEKDGRRVELWRPTVRIDDAQDFMERYSDFNVQVIAREPLDIIANPTFLPDCIAREYEALWTPVRMKRIVDAAVQFNVAIEINSRYRLPSMNFLRMARQAGAKFSFGSNIHGLDVGKLDYCMEAAKELGLTKNEIFVPAPRGKKPIEVRRFA